MNKRDDKLLLARGSHRGYDWKILHNGMGFRCGYIKIPEEHPWYRKNYDNISVDCHGGLTYSRVEEDGYWIGFDCAHLGDAQDITLPYDHIMPSFNRGATIKDNNYVQRECEKLCEQAQSAR